MTKVESGLAKLHEIYDGATSYLVERETQTLVSIFALICKQHVLFLGPPGASKSMLVRAIVAAFKGVKYFERLMSKTLPRDAVVGPVDLEGIAEKDYRTIVDGFMPDAHFVDLEEIYKAGPIVLTDVLPISNERIYPNGKTIVQCPLETIFASSNELYEGEALDALDSRFLFRCWTDYITEHDSFIQFVDNVRSGEAPPTDGIGMTLDELHEVQDAAKKIPFGRDAAEILWEIREAFKREGLVIDDRRLAWIVKTVCGASALWNGRSQVEPEDFEILEHCLWRDPKDRAKVSEIVLKVSNPVLEESRRYLDDATRAFATAKDLIGKATDQAERQDAGQDAATTLMRVLESLQKRAKETEGKSRKTFVETHKKVTAIQKQVVQELYALDSFDLGSGIDLEELEEA